MTILILERVAPSVRGDLSRWLIEVKTGVFVGKVSKLVREALWERSLKRAEEGTVILIWRTNTQQGFDVRCHQPKGRMPVKMEGLWLAMVPDPDPRRVI